MKTCKYPNCSNPATRKGLCNAHYMRQYRKAMKDTLSYVALEQFIDALPTLLRQVGATGYAASYDNGTVTIRKLGTKMTVTWPEG